MQSSVAITQAPVAIAPACLFDLDANGYILYWKGGSSEYRPDDLHDVPDAPIGVFAFEHLRAGDRCYFTEPYVPSPTREEDFASAVLVHGRRIDYIAWFSTRPREAMSRGNRDWSRGHREEAALRGL